MLTNPLQMADMIITNPPWDTKILHPMIEHFRSQNTTWLLFDADWMHTKQSSERFESPVFELVPAVLFVAGLMGLVALLSQV